jgi:hypothetical protein
MSIDELKIKLAELLQQLAQGEKAMAAIAPDMALALEPLFNIPPEEVQKAVDKLVETMPEDKREVILESVVSQLEGALEHQEFTKWRIDARVQPPDKLRQEVPFKSFCKRKGDWS